MKREALRAEGLSLTMDGVALLKDISFTAFQGELLSVCGYQHTGRSVLSRTLSGEIPYDSGCLHAYNEHSSARGQEVIYRMGQTGAFVGERSIMDNFYAYRNKHRYISVFPQKVARIQTQYYLDKLNLPFAPDDPASILDTPQTHLLEIAKAIDHGYGIILMDNSAFEYNFYQLQRLLEMIRENAQATFIYITNREDIIVQASDQIICFSEGKITGKMTKGNYSTAKLTAMMGGGGVSFGEKRERAAGASPVAGGTAFKFAPKNGMLANQPLTVKNGEIVGILDLFGSYWPNMRQILFDPNMGDTELMGMRVTSIEQALSRGMSFVSINKEEMIFPGLSMHDHLTLGILKRSSRFGVLSGRILGFARSEIVSDRALVNDVGNPNLDFRLLALYRQLVARPRFLLLENILVGLSGKKREAIYREIQQAAARGTAVLLVTTSVEECRVLCDRTLILHDNDYFQWSGRAIFGENSS